MLTSAVRYQVSLIGLDKRFVESELKIVGSLRSGSALLHHLEPSYYAAIRVARAQTSRLLRKTFCSVTPDSP
jgi:hypothetical protein